MTTYFKRAKHLVFLAMVLVWGCDRDLTSMGIRAFQEGDLQKAEALFNQVLEQDIGDPSAIMNLAIIRLKQGQPDSAMNGFSQVAALLPNDPRPLEYMASILMDNNRWREAGEVLTEAARRDPQSPSVMTAQALVDLYTVGASAARTRLNQVAAMDPRYAPVLFNIGVIERDWLKNPAGGKRYFQRYLALAKNDAHVAVARTALSEKTSANQKNSGVMSKTGDAAPVKSVVVATPPPALPASARNPQEAADAFRQGLRHHQAREFDKAIQGYTLAINHDPTMVRAHFNLGLLLRNKGDLAHSRESFERALALAPGMTDARYMLALVLSDQGDTGNAITHLKSIVEKMPDHADAHLALGMLYKKDKATISLARKELTRYLKLDPNGVAAKEVRNWLKYQD